MRSEGEPVIARRRSSCRVELHRRAYIVAFSLFIYGMSGLTGPRTAVRGNKIAAAGMVIAVVATLLTRGVLTARARRG